MPTFPKVSNWSLACCQQEGVYEIIIVRYFMQDTHEVWLTLRSSFDSSFNGKHSSLAPSDKEGIVKAFFKNPLIQRCDLSHGHLPRCFLFSVF